MNWGNVAGAGISAAGSVIGAIGALQAADAEHDALVANAAEAYRQGREERVLARHESRQIRQAGAALQGQIVAESAKSGLAMSGTPLATVVRTARQAWISAQLKARAGEISHDQYAAQGHAYDKAAKAAKKAGKMQAAMSLLGMAG